MPQNFRDPKQQTPALQAQAPSPSQNQPQDQTQEAAPKPPTFYDLVTRGMDESDKARLNTIREKIVNENAIPKFMFSEDAAFTFSANKYLTLTVRIMSSDEKEDVDGYSMAKDTLGLFTAKDESEIAKLKAAEPDLSSAQVRELFLRTFPKDVADSRMARVSLATSVLRINDKGVGANVKERFAAISKLPIVTIRQIQIALDLLDRAIKLELSDEAAIKN